MEKTFLESRAGADRAAMVPGRKQRKRPKKVKSQSKQPVEQDASAADSNPTVWFKQFYDNFFAKEQALKRLT